MKRYLLCNGDATQLSTHGGLPYYLLQAGLENGILDAGIRLHPKKLRANRFAFNAFQLLKSGKASGFQYSKHFTKKLFSQAKLNRTEPAQILSIYPPLPPEPWPENWKVGFYIDATTEQILNDYNTGCRISARFQATILKREREAYKKAHAIICRSQWAADSILQNDQIDAHKIHVVPGGANLDEGILAALPPPSPPPPPSASAPLRLGFLGKDWHRKGGPFLLELASSLNAAGLPVVVRAIGPDPSALPVHPQLQALGFINKQTETARFAAEVRSWHFGTLFSSAEAFGLSNRECLRLGVPVLCHNVGGIRNTIPDQGCGQLFDAHPSGVEVATWIQTRLDPYDAYLAWRAALSERSAEFTWAAAVRQLQPLLEWH